MHGTSIHGNSRLSAASAEDAIKQADFPVTFAGTVGLYHAAEQSSDTAVLFVGSWGFEEFCARKFWRLLAEDLGQQGICSLRFDYPGTGDALDLKDYSAGLDIWQQSILSAAAVLRDLSGAKKLLLVGHSIGAAFAWQAAEALGDVAGIVMAAPAPSGRRWAREFMALSRIAYQNETINAAASGPAMGEQRIPDAILTGIRALDISKATKAPAPDILVLSRQDRATDADLADHIATLGTKVRSTPFEGYDLFIRDVLLSVPPQAMIAEITAWAKGFQGESQPVCGTVQPETHPLVGDGFTETPVRFGEGDRLYGILCEPQGPRRGATVIMLSTGYDRMSGWGRITTRICRDIAREGVASLRFDFGNVADSPPHPDAPRQIIYNECLVRDVGQAIEFLDARKLFPIIISGRCSGGHAAFQSGVRFERVDAIVPVNPFDYNISPDADVEELFKVSFQPLSSYNDKMRSGGFWKRVLRGEVNVARGAWNMSRMLASKGFATILPVLVRFPFLVRGLRAVTRDFETLVANGTQVSLIYSKDDFGIPNLETRFGKQGYLLNRYSNTRIVFLSDTDHNLTTAPAREYWQGELQKMAFRFKP